MTQQSYYWAHTLKKTIIQKDTCTPGFTASLFTITRTWKQTKCPLTEEWIKKIQCIHPHTHTHTHTGILLSHKQERNWVVCSDVDGPRVCHTEWCKSGREKQILHINAYIWNQEKWYRQTSLQGRNRDTDIENGLVDRVREGERGTNCESSFDTHTHYHE